MQHGSSAGAEEPQGIMARFACRVTRDSRRRQASLPCAVPEYKRHGDYLTNSATAETPACETHAAQGVRVTRFHRGFFRAREAGQVQDERRRGQEEQREQQDSENCKMRFEQWRQDSQRGYNILTGEGAQAERREGVKLVPGATNRTKEGQQRLRMGKFRFFDDSGFWTNKETREKTLECEGFSETHKESVVIGIPPAAKPRLRLLSVGVRDNFAHTQLSTPGKPFDAVLHRNASQIVFG